MTDYYKKYLKYKQKYLQTKKSILIGGMEPSISSALTLDEGFLVMNTLGRILSFESFLVDSIHDDLFIPFYGELDNVHNIPSLYNEDKIIRNTIKDNKDLIGLVVSDAVPNDYIKSDTFISDNDDFKKNIERIENILKDSVVFIDAGAGGFQSMHNDDKQPWKPQNEKNWICGNNKIDIYNVTNSNHFNTNTLSNFFDSATIGKGCPVCIKTLAFILNKSPNHVINEFYKLLLEFLDGHTEMPTHPLNEYWQPAIQFLKNINFTIGSNCKIYAEFNGTRSLFIISQAMCAEKINDLGGGAIPRKDKIDTDKKDFIENLHKFLVEQGESEEIQKMVYRILKYMGDKSHFVWAVYLLILDAHLKNPTYGWESAAMDVDEEHQNFDIYQKNGNTSNIIQWLKSSSDIILMTIDRLLFSDMVKIINSLQNGTGIYKQIYNRISIFISRSNGKIPISCDDLPLYTYVSNSVLGENPNCITVYKGESNQKKFELFLNLIYSELISAKNTENSDTEIDTGIDSILKIIKSVEDQNNYTQENLNDLKTIRYIYENCIIINKRNYVQKKDEKMRIFYKEIKNNLDTLEADKYLNHYKKNLVIEDKEQLQGSGRLSRGASTGLSTPILALKPSPILLGLFNPKLQKVSATGRNDTYAPHNYDLEIYTPYLDNLTYIYKYLNKDNLEEKYIDHIDEKTIIFDFCDKYIKFFQPDKNSTGDSVKIVRTMMWVPFKTIGLESWEVNEDANFFNAILQQDIYYALESINDICYKILDIYNRIKGKKFNSLSPYDMKLKLANIILSEDIIPLELINEIHSDETNGSIEIFDKKIDDFRNSLSNSTHSGGSTINSEGIISEVGFLPAASGLSEEYIKNIQNSNKDITNQLASLSLSENKIHSAYSSCIRTINYLELQNVRLDIDLKDLTIENIRAGIDPMNMYNMTKNTMFIYINEKIQEQFFETGTEVLKALANTLYLLTYGSFNNSTMNTELQKIVFIKFHSFINNKKILFSKVKNLHNIIEIYSTNNKDPVYKLALDIYMYIYIFYYFYYKIENLSTLFTDQNAIVFKNELDLFISNMEQGAIPFKNKLDLFISNNQLFEINSPDQYNDINKPILYSVYFDLMNSTIKKLQDLAHKFDKVYMDEFFDFKTYTPTEMEQDQMQQEVNKRLRDFKSHGKKSGFERRREEALKRQREAKLDRQSQARKMAE